MRTPLAVAALSAAVVLGGCASTTAPSPASSSATGAQTAPSAQAATTSATTSATATSTAARAPRTTAHRRAGTGAGTVTSGTHPRSPDRRIRGDRIRPSATLHDELQLLDAGSGAPAVAGGGRAWLTQARVTRPGCYGCQVDGTGFSEVFVFRAVG